MSECEVLMGKLEGIVQAPAASAEDLINVIGNLSSSTVDAPRILPGALQQRLGSIAARHGGQVPLHGRLFAQWLHFAFPYECPFPSLPEDPTVLLSKFWADHPNVAVTNTTRVGLAANYSLLNITEALPEEVHERAWSDDEMLPLAAPAAQKALVRSVCVLVPRAVLLLT